MRTYAKTHPWITFQVNLQEADYQFWMLLGEAQSKCEHLAGVPLLPDVAEQLHRIFLAKGVLATTAIEGNTLTEEEVLQHLKGQLTLPPSKAYLQQEVENIIQACNRIANHMIHGHPTALCMETIMAYNQIVLNDLPLSDEVIPGKIRGYHVGVGRYRGAPPEDCAHLLEKLCQWLNTEFVSSPEHRVAFGILKAIVAHVYTAWIHPFGDGNGRTARLIEFQILLSVGIPSTAAHLFSNFYNQTRSEYYRQLDRSHQSGGDLLPFVTYALRGFVDNLKDQIQMITDQQLHVHWINYVHAQFQNKDKATDHRKRRLIIDLSEQQEPVPFSNVRHITPRIAEAYANKTDKTIKRDIHVLEEMGLVKKTIQGIQARKEIMFAFLAPKREEDRET